MKVAFATQDLVTVDAHFGWAPHLVVYDVDERGARLLARHDFEEAREDGDEDKLGPRLAALQGCAVVVVMAMGGSASARAAAAGVRAVKLGEARPIAALLDGLVQAVITPPPWLRKILDRPLAGPGPEGGGR